jgi:hypothetical protein
MPDFEQDVDDGFRSGLERWGEEIGVTVDDSLLPLLEEPRRLALAVLYDHEARGGHLGRPGVTMFAEWVAVAAIVRLAHGETPVQRDDLDTFLPPAIEFLNTAFCPPPKSKLPTVGGVWPSGVKVQAPGAGNQREREAGALG